jgi:hypothetical protein
VDVSAVEFEGRRGLRGRLGGGASLSARATLFLALSTFLCGCAAAGLVFVGVWRHAATEQANAQAAQQSFRQQLIAAEHTLADLRAQVTRDERLIVHSRRQAARSASALEQAAKLNRALVGSLSPDLQELIRAGGTLASQTDTIQSELNALETYLQHPGAAGLDAGYLATQVRYLVRSAAAASSAAVDLGRQTRKAQATFAQSASR